MEDIDFIDSDPEIEDSQVLAEIQMFEDLDEENDLPNLKEMIIKDNRIKQRLESERERLRKDLALWRRDSINCEFPDNKLMKIKKILDDRAIKLKNKEKNFLKVENDILRQICQERNRDQLSYIYSPQPAVKIAAPGPQINWKKIRNPYVKSMIPLFPIANNLEKYESLRYRNWLSKLSKDTYFTFK
ncbi:unnamed protein product [Blepharisma stoltei]|uniref:Uncharacterized protein n=1 Tax=Blepharisma stoltei TaxID=1481888 RepID=A0AAU9KEB8_9CILI|nr:unnamed protein product [Blepharisma stoltei]